MVCLLLIDHNPPQVQIILKNRKDISMPEEYLGVERGSGTLGGDACMCEGAAYAIWGKARYKMLHDAIVPPYSPAIEGLQQPMVGGIARVGFTFRYYRRTFLEIRQETQQSPSPLSAPPLSAPLFKPFEYVDAYYYVDGTQDGAHHYTYAAIVLRVDASLRTLTLQYLSDGLGADTDDEAFHIADRVPVEHVRSASKGVQALLSSEECNWTRRSLRKVEEIRAMGVDAYLQARDCVK